MRRFFILILVVGWLIPIGGQGQSYSHIEYENLSNLSSAKWFGPQINILGTNLKKDATWGTYFFALLNPGWGQAYGGILYRPADWVIFRAGAGLETDSLPWRVNLTSMMFLNRFTFLQIYEYGGSGFWYNIILNYAVTPQFQAGAILKRFYGLGLNLEYQLPRTPITLNLAPLYDFEFGESKLMFIFRYAFL